MRRLPPLALSFSLLAIASAAHAQDYTLGTLTVRQPWSQALPAHSPSVAAYFTVANSGTENDVLLSVDTPIAGQAQVHQHVSHDGMMKMQPVNSVVVPAAGEAVFTPMGNHVMLLDLSDTAPLQAGGQFPLTLHFQRAGDLTVDVNVLTDAPAPPPRQRRLMLAQRTFRHAGRAALFAVLMLFIGPLLSQALPAHHGMASVSSPVTGHHHGSETAPHPLWERCGYCSLFFHCPALPHTLPLNGTAMPPDTLAPANGVLRGHNNVARFPGALTRAPPFTPV